ncbi:hypothetical protein DL769_000179 [Monosporascus sp. CRB-8-3]|nr:hypothetical protein DL769_000179 [Monosporascus sp. CRB-8-3]
MGTLEKLSGNSEDVSTSADTVSEPPKQRFLIRAISCVLVPPAVAAYYIWTYGEFLRPSTRNRDASSPAPDGRYIWWSWFVIGAIGLNVSTYVLAGVEAGMLTTLRFGVLSTDQLSMHTDKSWSKISGWVDVARKFVFRQPVDRPTLSWVWIPLFLLSVLSWSFALTGLTMETEDSFKAGDTTNASVVGANATSFNRRSTFDVLDAAFHEWRQARLARPPSVGAVYSIPGSSFDFNMTTGNTLPSTADTPIFLGPQAETPVTGSVWGIAFRYGCKPIHGLSDFRILSRRINSTVSGYISGTEMREEASEGQWYTDVPEHFFYEVPGLAPATISVLKKRRSWENIDTFAEVALSAGVYSLSNFERGYTPGSHNGLDDEEVLEFALWQDSDQLGDPRNMEGIIPELTGEYFNFGDYRDPENPNALRPMAAIGVQCTSSSDSGFARVDGVGGTFHDFNSHSVIGLRLDEEDWFEFHMYNLPRFSRAIPTMFLPGLRGSFAFDITMESASYEPLRDAEPWMPASDIDYRHVAVSGGWFLDLASTDWLTAVFAAGNLPLDMSDDLSAGSVRYERYLKPEELQRGLEEAHKHVAEKLMYNQHDNPIQMWLQPNLTAAVPWERLVPADDGVPALLVLVLLGIWALGCMVLGVMYSFRKRWHAYFSMGSMYWYCKTMAHVDPVEAMRGSN